LAESIVAYFGPFRERRLELQSRPDYVRDVIRDGAERASRVARATLTEVKAAMNLLP
jgi:tryptophanyl-tRNA synthetase